MPIQYDDRYLLRPGIKKEYTAEMIQHIMSCSRDVLYFASNFYTIIHPTKGQMIIPLFKFQKEMLKAFQENRFNIILSARQIGKSTCACIFILWFAIFNKDKTIAILANKQNTAKSLIEDIKKAYAELPAWIKPGLEEYNALNITFENGTKIFASATTEDALRGESVSLLFCDEFAFVPQNIAEAFWKSNFPTLSQGGAAILVSTPNGAAGKFYEIYKEAEGGNSPFKPFKVNWHEFPGRDEKWKEDMIAAVGKVGFQQEYACVLGNTRINIRVNDIIYEVEIGELYEKGSDFLSTLPNTN